MTKLSFEISLLVISVILGSALSRERSKSSSKPNPISQCSAGQDLSNNRAKCPLGHMRTGSKASKREQNENDDVSESTCVFETDLVCDSTEKYRTANGACNNLNNPLLGAADTPYKRYITPAYKDGFSTARSTGQYNNALPNVRDISLSVSPPADATSQPLESELTLALTYFGQFLTHDFAGTAAHTDESGTELECDCDSTDTMCALAVTFPSGDGFTNMTCMSFTRSSQTSTNLACEETTFVEQLNVMSAYLDGSQIYGVDADTEKELRTFMDGLLATSDSEGLTSKTYLPLDPDTMCSDTNRECFLAGEFRTSENLGLTNVHMLFNREHNRIATELSALQPTYGDELLFQETKRIVLALYQHIVYNEWLPLVVGDDSLSPLTSGFYNGYNSTVDPSISNEVSTAAMRFGHTLVRDTFSARPETMSRTSITFDDIIFNSDLAYNENIDGLNGIMLGEIQERAWRAGTFPLVLQNRLFLTVDDDTGLSSHIDLFAFNVNRGRDHGLPSYADTVRECQGSETDINQYVRSNIRPNKIDKLDAVYESVEDYDLYAAGISETRNDGVVGPTFACLLKRQFEELRDGDRFYYENSGAQAFTEDQLSAIRSTSFAGMVCNNFDVTNIQPNPFLVDTAANNAQVSCSTIGQLDLNKWQ